MGLRRCDCWFLLERDSRLGEASQSRRRDSAWRDEERVCRVAEDGRGKLESRLGHVSGLPEVRSL